MASTAARLKPVAASGFTLASALVLSIAAAAAPLAPRLPSPTPLPWVPNGPVHAVAPFGNRLLIGGSFTKISPRTGQAALTDPTTGAPKTGFPELAGGAVDAIVSDGAGGWFAGGFFRYADGLSRTGLVRVLADGSIDSRFDPSLMFVYNVSSANPAGQIEPAGVTALALSGSTLYVGGTFDRADGLERNGLAAFDLGTGAITAWNPRATSSGNFVRALAVGANAVYVAGGFSGIGGAARSGVAALDAATGQATAWNPAPDQPAATVALGQGVVYVGGSFTKIGGVGRQYLAAFDQSTGAVRAWAPGVPAPVTRIAAAGDTVAVASEIRNRATRTGTVYELTAGDGASRWRVDTDGPVAALTLAGSDLLVAGGFRTIGGVPRHGVARFDATGELSGWAPQPNLLVQEFGGGSSVDALAVTSAGVVIGGDFVSVGGVSRSGLAAIDLGGKPSSWHPTLNGEVSALAAGAGRVYVAGRFTKVGGKARRGAAAFDARLALLPWNPPALVAAPPNDLAVLPGMVVMTGQFNGVAPGKEFHGSIAAFDPRDGHLLAWGPSNLVGDGIGPLLSAGGRVYTTFSVDTSTVVLLDPETGRMRKGFVHNNGTGDIYAMALAGRTLYLGGAMQAVDFQYRTRFAAIDARSGKLLPWKPTADESVFSLLARGGVIYAGGQFKHVGGAARSGLAALDATSGALLGWNPKLSGNVRGLVGFDGGFAAIGDFLSVDGHAEPYLALFSTG